MRRRRVAEREAVAQPRAGQVAQRCQRVGQRSQVGAVQAEPVDLGGRHDHHGDRAGTADDRGGHLLAAYGWNPLGVVETLQHVVDVALGVETDGGRHQRAGQAAAARLISPGHVAHAERAVMGEQLDCGHNGNCHLAGQGTPAGGRSASTSVQSVRSRSGGQ